MHFFSNYTSFFVSFIQSQKVKMEYHHHVIYSTAVKTSWKDSMNLHDTWLANRNKGSYSRPNDCTILWFHGLITHHIHSPILPLYKLIVICPGPAHSQPRLERSSQHQVQNNNITRNNNRARKLQLSDVDWYVDFLLFHHLVLKN